MAYNYNNYHYWKGSFKGLLPNEILNLSNKDFNILLEEFNSAGIQGIGDRKYILNSSRKRIPILKQYFIDMLKDFEYKENEDIILFRSITVDNKEEINLSEKGICWTPVATTLPYIERVVLQNFGKPLKKYIVRFSGHTSIENIDWIESLFLYINYNKAEREIRVYDSLKVVLDGYLCIDSKTKNIYSRDIEDINPIISKFLEFNPVTKRYDSKNSSSYFFIMTKEILLYLIKDGKFSIPFGKIDGDFDCSSLGLTSLEGAPTEVVGRFSCSENQLTSLKGAPQTVGRYFNCSRNQLTSLEGAPQNAEGRFDCSYNQLTSLEGAPREVGENFNCANNKLTSLKGAPREVGGSFDCSINNLTSLEGAPQKVGRTFWCNGNKLTSLEGAPQIVEGYFYCTYNPNLHSLDGIGEVKGKIIKSF